MKRCPKCRGTGNIDQESMDYWTSNVSAGTVCPDCEGSGYLAGEINRCVQHPEGCRGRH